VIPGVLDRFPAPQGGEESQALVQHRRSPPEVRLLTEPVELPGALAADADTEHRPTSAQPIEGGGLTSDVPRPAPRKRGDHRTQANLIRFPGGHRQSHPRIDRGLVAAPMDDVIHQEPSLPAGGLRACDQIRKER
jgi:hypothetical protein